MNLQDTFYLVAIVFMSAVTIVTIVLGMLMFKVLKQMQMLAEQTQQSVENLQEMLEDRLIRPASFISAAMPVVSVIGKMMMDSKRRR